MKLEEQVCSLDLAKRLKELGVKQESLFYWYTTPNGNKFVGYKSQIDGRAYKPMNSAFTVAELGEMLPDIIAPSNTFGLEYSRRDENGEQRHMVAYTPISARVSSLAFINEIGTEADARAKMLCYLLENGLTKV